MGSLRAVQGVDVTCESAGLVQGILFKSGDDAKAGQLLVQFNVDSDIAQLSALEAAAELAKTTYERDKKQLDAQTISQAALDMDTADLKVKLAQVAQQKALVNKKTIRAPFAGQTRHQPGKPRAIREPRR